MPLAVLKRKRVSLVAFGERNGERCCGINSAAQENDRTFHLIVSFCGGRRCRSEGSHRLPLQSIVGAGGRLRIRIFGAHGERDSAARRELRGYDRLSRRTCPY